MTERHSIPLLGRDGETGVCFVEVLQSSPWQVLCTGCPNYGKVSYQREFWGDDLFDILTILRDDLERLGFTLLCMAARRDVFPSGMSRSMAGGRKAYVHRLGSPAVQGDLVDVLDTAPPHLVGTVQEQAHFHESWISSLKS